MSLTEKQQKQWDAMVKEAEKHEQQHPDGAAVRNYRDAFKAKYGVESKLSDARIWDITSEWVGLEGGIQAEEEAILEQMWEEQ